MTDRNKFEEMLERLVNEDRAGAEELFHEIVVERSREIYQSILESEAEEDEEVEEAADQDDEEELDESEDEDIEESDDEDLDEMFGLDELAPGDMGGDETDDMLGDVGMDDEGDMDMDMGADEGELSDRVQDLEDALQQLQAEFDAMMGDDTDSDDDAGEDDEVDMDMDMGDEEGEEEEEGDDEKAKEAYAFETKMKKDEKKDAKKDKKSAAEQMREYVEKVAPAKMGDNGANAKSIVAGKNDMGGTTANIAKGGSEAGVEANKGHLKGSSVFKGTPKEDNAGNINVPGGKAGKTAFKKSEPGHGAEKKGAGETAANKKPIIGGK